MQDKNQSQKGFVALVTPLMLAMGMGVAHANTPPYATDSAGQVVTNNYGECWNAKGGMNKPVEKCGDKIAAPAPAPMPVDGDADGDGVKDSMDKCPNTRAGAKVDASGCEIIQNVTIDLVNDEFDFDSAKLKPDMETALSKVAEKVLSTPGDEQLHIVGYTDSTGPDAYNMKLSIRRAQAVADYLARVGVDRNNMTIEGRGETNPVADNGTEAGRAKNRRVEITTK